MRSRFWNRHQHGSLGYTLFCFLVTVWLAVCLPAPAARSADAEIIVMRQKLEGAMTGLAEKYEACFDSHFRFYPDNRAPSTTRFPEMMEHFYGSGVFTKFKTMFHYSVTNSEFLNKCYGGRIPSVDIYVLYFDETVLSEIKKIEGQESLFRRGGWLNSKATSASYTIDFLDGHIIYTIQQLMSPVVNDLHIAREKVLEACARPLP